MLTLDLPKSALKFVEALPPKQFTQVFKKVLALMKDPEPNDSSDLQGYPFKRADIGEYRIIYHADRETLHVEVIGKRNDADIYRQLRNL
ncbi:MAG: type II toxin-antitoxin system RelE family toxin [Syntrophobacteraceae bacterium]